MKFKRCPLVLAAALLVLLAASCGETDGPGGQTEPTAADTPAVTAPADETDETAPTPGTDPETLPETQPETLPETQPPHVHAFGDWIDKTPASCTEPGLRTRTCACGETEEETVPAAGHTMGVLPAVPASCASPGMTEGIACTVCGLVSDAGHPVCPTGHAFGQDNVCTVCGRAASDGLRITANGDGTCTVTGRGSCRDTDLVIPGFGPDGSRVTAVGDQAFETDQILASVELPDTLTHVGSYAFTECPALASAALPEGLIALGAGAFMDSPALASLCLPGTLTSMGAYAFAGCTGLADVILPAGAVPGMYAFTGCTGLTSVTIPEGWTTLPSSLFSGCTGLSTLSLPDSLTGIGYAAFNGCAALEVLALPPALDTIGSYAFAGCAAVTALDLPASVTSIGEAAFSGCAGLLSVTVDDVNRNYLSECNCLMDTDGTLLVGCRASVIPEYTRVIAPYAFNQCTELTEVTLPDGLISIGTYAFGGCTGLYELFIPKSVTTIEDYAFADCPRLAVLCEAKSRPARFGSRWDWYSHNNKQVVVRWGWSRE